MSSPIMFQQQNMNSFFNLQPNEVKGRANNSVEFHKRYLYMKLYSVFKFTLPDSWAENFFRYWLLQFGSVAVIYTSEYGWIPQPYSILELDLYYQPKQIQIYNQFIKEAKVGIVGLNSGIIKMCDDYFSLDDIVTRYAEMLAEVDKSININLMNSNIAMLFEAESKKEADTIKEAYAEATTGKPLITIGKNTLKGEGLKPLIPGIQQNYIADKLLEARRTIVNNFLTEIGIRNANYDKKERLNSQEVEENNDETSAIVSLIYENMKAGMETINAISGLSLDVEMRYDYSEGGPTDENDTLRDV